MIKQTLANGLRLCDYKVTVNYYNVCVHPYIVHMVCWELTKELGKRSREFFEYVLPAIDIVEETNDLVIKIDLPGFRKENIDLRIVEDILTINARREEPEQHIRTQYYKQRPLNISRKVVLPISTEDDEKAVGTAKYEDGVVTLRIPIPKSGYIPIT